MEKVSLDENFEITVVRLDEHTATRNNYEKSCILLLTNLSTPAFKKRYKKSNKKLLDGTVFREPGLVFKIAGSNLSVEVLSGCCWSTLDHANPHTTRVYASCRGCNARVAKSKIPNDAFVDSLMAKYGDATSRRLLRRNYPSLEDFTERWFDHFIDNTLEASLLASSFRELITERTEQSHLEFVELQNADAKALKDKNKLDKERRESKLVNTFMAKVEARYGEVGLTKEQIEMLNEIKNEELQKGVRFKGK